jgi:hypothetical protein
LSTLWRLSKFAAQIFGKPSSFVKTTSVGILRIVEVMGATVSGIQFPPWPPKNPLFFL